MNSKPKILFIMHMPPPVHGASMMGKYIHDSKIVNESFECHYLNPTTAKNLEDVNKFRVGKVFDIFNLIKRIKAKVREVQPDLVYFTANASGMPFYKDYLIVRALKQMKCKIVIHYHNKGVSTRQDKWLDDKLYRNFFMGLKIILLAEALYSDIQKYVKREDVQICPNGIPETLDYEPVAKRDNDIPHILFLSNLIESKGVIVLLDALKILKDRGMSFVCDFVGGETAEIDAARFQREVEERNLSEVAIYAGRKYGLDKKGYFEKADIFAFPSYYHNECFPLVLLEGMMHGLACVSTHEAGIPGIIDDYLLGGSNKKMEASGILVERKNAKQLADAIELLANDRGLCGQIGIAGRKKYEEQFTLAAFEKRLVEILKQLAIENYDSL